MLKRVRMRALTLIRDAHGPYINILLHPANPLCPLRFTCSGWNSERRHNCDPPPYVSGRSSVAFLGDDRPRGDIPRVLCIYLNTRARLYKILPHARVPLLHSESWCIVARSPHAFPNPFVEVQFPLGGPPGTATRGAFFMNKSWVSEMLMAETFADDISVCRPDMVENMLSVRRGRLRIDRLKAII